VSHASSEDVLMMMMMIEDEDAEDFWNSLALIVSC